MTLPKQITIVEVGPRDGLQNEATIISTSSKIAFIQQLQATGIRIIETTSFVSPKWVPQLADHKELMIALLTQQQQDHYTKNRPHTKYFHTHFPVLIPNMHGLQTALEVGVKDIAIFATASETFSKNNINCSIRESLHRYEYVAKQALDEGLRVRGYVSCVLGCPYEGEISSNAVVKVAKALLDMGCYEISLGDTIGIGTPEKARHIFETVANSIPIEQIAAHFHDTYGQALANLYAVLQLGVTTIDSSVAGLGGCPYARGASGNVATEDVLYMLQGMGIETGINLTDLIAVGKDICRQLHRVNGSKVAKAMGS